MAFDVPDQEPVWVQLSAQPDKIMARMVATMLSANGIHARVTEVLGQICVEVKEQDFDHALKIYEPTDSTISPLLQENDQATGIHTGKRIKEQLAARAVGKAAWPEPISSNAVQWAIVLAMLCACVAFLIWVYVS